MKEIDLFINFIETWKKMFHQKVLFNFFRPSKEISCSCDSPFICKHSEDVFICFLGQYSYDGNGLPEAVPTPLERAATLFRALDRHAF
jgi:hypothetical protein